MNQSKVPAKNSSDGHKTIIEAKINEIQDQLNKLFESLKIQNDKYKPIDEKEDELDKVIDFLQRKKQVCKDNDQFLVKKNILEGFFNCAKSFDPQNEKIIEENGNKFNDFYTKLVQKLYNLKIIATDFELDEFLKLALTKKEKTKEEIVNFQKMKQDLEKKNEENLKEIKKLNEITAQMQENSANSLKEKVTKIDQLEASLKQINDENKKSIDELNKSQKEKEDLSKMNDKNINERNKFIENMKVFQVENENLKNSLNDKIKNNEKLEQSIKQLKDDISKSSNEKPKNNNDLEALNKQLKEENEKLKKDPKRSSEEYKIIIEGKIKETKEQLNKLLESLKNKDDNYKPIQDQDELAKIIDFLERKKQVTKENDDILIKRHELIGFFKCAISFDQINTKIIEEKYIEFNIFYSNLINSVQNLKIMATDLNLDEYLNLARTKKANINKTIASLQQENQRISSENKKLTENSNEMKKNIENLKNRENSEILNVSEKSHKNETNDSLKINNDIIYENQRLKQANDQYIENDRKMKENEKMAQKTIDSLKIANKELTDNLNKLQNAEKEAKNQIFNEDLKENILNNLKKENTELIERFSNKILQEKQEKRKKLQEEFNNQKLALLKKIEENQAKINNLEKENSEIKEKNSKLEQIFSPKFENKIKALMKAKITLVLNNIDKNINQKLLKLQDELKNLTIKFQFYKQNYDNYHHFFHTSTVLLALRGIIIHDKGVSDNKILYESLTDSKKAQIEVTFPEQYRYIDKESVIHKIRCLLKNTVRLNQFAKIFYKIMTKFYPQSNSQDVVSKNINESFKNIWDSLDNIDKYINEEYVSIDKNYSEIMNNDSPNKNLVEIFDKCFALESECVKRILDLEGF